MKNPWCQHGAIILALAALLAGCQPQGVRPAPQAMNDAATNNPPFVDLDAALSEAVKGQRPLILLIAESEHDSADNDAIALLADPAVGSNADRVTPVLLDVRLSRNRATATRFHLTDTPMLVCLSPRGVIVSRDEKPITKNLVLRQIAETVRLAPDLDAKLTLLEAAVAKNTSDAAARLNLADFLLAHQNAREAIPHLASVAHVESAEAGVRVRAWVALARAHLWIAEPEKGRHEATELIATLGMEMPDARAGGKLVLGLQDAKGKRFALARREFEEAIAAAPRSAYAKQAAEEAAKLPNRGEIDMVRRAPFVVAVAAFLIGAAVVMTVRHWVANSNRSHSSDRPTVVLYCATDREIAQDLIDQFEKETGIHVEAKFDTEAAKAVGLVQAIRQEDRAPQCDVFWGGGAFFCTILANDGCLAPVPEDLLRAHGSAPRDAQGRWLGFAAAYRVLIVNTDVLAPEARPHSYRDLTDPRFKGHVGIANPLFGGMAAHVAALFSTLGDSQGRQWLAGLRNNDCALCAGMADVKNRVASGELWFGITSTIDAHVAVDGGKPVVIVFPDQAPGDIGCLCGYNAVALVAGAPHPWEAEKLIRFLMTTKTEKILADGPGQNVGMLPESIAQDVRPAWIPRNIRTMEVDWSQAVKAHPAATRAVREILLDQ